MHYVLQTNLCVRLRQEAQLAFHKKKEIFQVDQINSSEYATKLGQIEWLPTAVARIKTLHGPELRQPTKINLGHFGKAFLAAEHLSMQTYS